MGYDRKYLCPFCQNKIPKSKLVTHLGRLHTDKLPEGFTPLQTAYHIINNRPLDYTRKCRICNNPTKWDENKGRYNFLCGNPNCDKAWTEKMKATMGDKYGAYRPTATPEGLKKMLAARKISGSYKFQDGHEFTYTGSYELEALKFFDQVLQVKSEDLQVPGPVLQYDFQGKTHLYITDMYYIPYNLIIEVKDGGSNPNMNPSLAEVRAKQMAKENYIIKKTEYNYLRLTDKDMSQVFNIFAELKLNLVENDPTRIIRVHEALVESALKDEDKPGKCPNCGSNRYGIYFLDPKRPVLMCKMCGYEFKDLPNNVYGVLKENMYAAMQGFMPMNPHDTLIVNYMKKNTFVDEEDYAIAFDQKFNSLFARDESGVFKKVNRKFLEGCIYTPYIVEGNRDKVEAFIKEKLDTVVDKYSIYEAVFDHPLYSDDQIMFEEKAKSYKDYYKVLADTEDLVANLIQPGTKAYAPLMENATIKNRWYIKSDDGATNCCVKIPKYEKSLRGRSTMIPLKFEKGKWKCFFKRKKDFTQDGYEFDAPGGGWDKGETPEQAAIRECQEEVRMNVRKVKFMGEMIEYYEDAREWVKKHVKNPEDWWYGYYSMIYCGMYDSEFTGKVAELDKDPYMSSGKWYNFDDIKSGLAKEHRHAIEDYIKSVKKEEEV